MKPFCDFNSFRSLWAMFCLVCAPVALGQGDDRFVGIWVADQGFRTVEILFRSDGRYRVDARSPDSMFAHTLLDQGHYQTADGTLSLISYGYVNQPAAVVYEFQLVGDSLSLQGGLIDPLPRNYELMPGSSEEVLKREQASRDLVRRWTRHRHFLGDEEYTFRPGGYFCFKTTYEDPQFAPVNVRGRHEQTGSQLILKPYGRTESKYETDIFGDTLTLIETNAWFGQYTCYVEVPASGPEVSAKAAEAEAFLSRPNWQAGVWRIVDDKNTIDLTLRPDGIYAATNTTTALRRVLRGRFTLGPRQMRIVPFVGQEQFVLDEADFGIAEQTYAVDFYDGELQLIDLEEDFTEPKLARKEPGTEDTVLELAHQARVERERKGWVIGIWEGLESGVWMEFTFRPDDRYIAKLGAGGVASEVERGRYVVSPTKFTLAPYPGNGAARGFEYDLYDGDLFLIGDAMRLVILRKNPGSEISVTEKARDPAALKGERGSILGQWTANRLHESVELVFRQDGQFRLKRCTNGTVTTDYGLYAVDMANRTLVNDSRFIPIQTQQLDFYGDTLTIYGGLTNGAPATYIVNLGSVDAAIAASLAADAEESQVNQVWLERVPVSTRDPNAVQPQLPGFPSDPNAEQVFEAPTIFSQYQFYRRLIPCFVPVVVNGNVISVGVVDSQEWHFFPTGRVLVRFRTHHGDWSEIIEEVADLWGAYQIVSKPAARDILHFYADNGLTVLTDLGEEVMLTLENGRRTLFWGKEFCLQGDWASERQPSACQLNDNLNDSLINTGLSLTTRIDPDPAGEPGPLWIWIQRPVSGALTVNGSLEAESSLVLEQAVSLSCPITWQPLQTNTFPAGHFQFNLSEGIDTTAFFRIRLP